VTESRQHLNSAILQRWRSTGDALLRALAASTDHHRRAAACAPIAAAKNVVPFPTTVSHLTRPHADLTWSELGIAVASGVKSP
jgi:hypothetical protein